MVVVGVGAAGLEEKKMTDHSDRVDCVENCIENCFIAVCRGGKI